MTDREAMKMALEALEWRFSNADAAIKALRQAIEQAEKQEKLCKYCGGIGRVVCDGRCMPEQEPVAWRSAAIRLGEELSSVGCDNYYNLTAEQWLDWALAQEPRGKNSLPTPRKEWVGLTDEEINAIGYKYGAGGLDLMDELSAMLKERNT
jgi:hypothetical protein